MDARITRLAATQHGVVSRRQLLAIGLPADTVRSIVRRGNLERLAVGVYGARGAPATAEREAMVAVLRCGPGALAVGERMLALLGLRELRTDGPFHLLVRPGRRVSNVPWETRPDPVARSAAVRVVGIPSVAPARLLVESCVRLGRGEVEPLVDAYRWSRFDLGPVRRFVAAHPSHPGSAVLTGSGLLREDAAESPKERELFELVRHLGAVRQHRVLPDVRVDIYIPVARLALEYQGKGTHGGERAIVRDSGRIARIEAAGIRVEPIHAADLRDPDALRARIERLVAYRRLTLDRS